MDRTDRQIAELLGDNGRRSNVDIARELGISEGTVRKRLERLLSSGTLRVVGAVDPVDLGYAVRALIFLRMELAQTERAAQTLQGMSEVMCVYLVTGEYDLIVQAVFETDQQLMAWLSERVSRIPGVISSQTAHVLHVVKHVYDWQAPPLNVPRVLIVDDDPDFVEATRLALEPEGYDIRAASNGDEALKAMITHPPHLVILDIMMRGVLDGWSASGSIRALPNVGRVPILVVSAIATSDYRDLFPTDDDHLIDAFLSKPVAPATLVAEVQRLLRRGN